LERDHDHRRGDDGGEVGRGAERRPAHSLQESGLAANDERDGQARESRGGHAIAEQADEQIRRGADAFDRLVAVHGTEQHEQDDREQEAEEGGLAVPPEETLLRPQLVQEQCHACSSRVSSR
jgi:hypothetical protein